MVRDRVRVKDSVRVKDRVRVRMALDGVNSYPARLVPHGMVRPHLSMFHSMLV